MSPSRLSGSRRVDYQSVSAREDVAIVPMSGEFMLLSASLRQLHRLNASAKQIWDAVAVGYTIDEIVNGLSEHYRLSPTQIGHHVRATVAGFERDRLLESLGPQDRSCGEFVAVRTCNDECSRSSNVASRQVIGPFVALESLVRLEVSGTDCGDHEVDLLGRRLHRAVMSLIRHRQPIEIEDSSLVVLRVERADGDWLVRSNDAIVARSRSVDVIYRAALAELNAAPLGALRRSVAFHAGGVQFPDGLVMFPGVSNAGKSTLVANLLQRGHRYLTDEAVAIDARSGEARVFPKAICVDAGAQAMFAHLQDGSLRGSTWDVDPISFSDAPIADSAAPIAVVFPTFVRGADVELNEISPLDAASRLLENSFEFAASGAAGAERLLRIAAEVPCMELQHGGQPQHLEVLENVFGSTRSSER